MSYYRSRAKTRVARRQRDRMASMPYGVLVSSVNPFTEEVIYIGPRGGSRTPISHPYVGPNSWVRIIPERATKAVLGTRAENGEPYLSGYISESASDRLIRSTENGQFYYRRMQEGEIELCSPGISELFLEKSGNLEIRGGAVSINLNNNNLEIASRSPTHSRSILGNKRQSIGDEERFGVVTRPSPQDPTQRRIIKVTDRESPDEVFAKEHLLVIKNLGNPATLVDQRLGHVISDSGETIVSGITGNPLRKMSHFGTINNKKTKIEVDDEGSYTIQVPSGATKGYFLEVSETDATTITGRDFILSSGRNVRIKTNNIGIGISENQISIGNDSGNFRQPGALIQGGQLNNNWRLLLPLASAIVAGSPPQNAIAIQTLQNIIIQMINALQPSLSNRVSVEP